MKDKTILDDEYTGTKTDLSKYVFRGKLAGKSWKREQALDRLKMARTVIFGMSLIMFYPVFMNYLGSGTLDWVWFIERLIFSIILIFCGVFYNKFRLAASIIALLPVALVLYTNIIYIHQVSTRVIGFNVAIFVLILVGIYFHFQEKKLSKLLKEEVRKDNPEAVKN